MLDTTRNHLIACAFRKANITSLESDPTPAEIEDAAHTLNTMLQSWNNDGFRLFKIHTGYMPFIPNVNEYSLKSQAYKSFEVGNVVDFERISASRLALTDFSGISAGQKIVIINNVEAHGVIDTVDFQANEAVLTTPMAEPLYQNDIVFFGDNFDIARTEIKTYGASFQTISFFGQSTMPRAGDFIWLQYQSVWQRYKIYSVDAANQTLTLDSPLGSGAISSAYIAYGSSVYQSKVKQDYPLKARLVRMTGITEVPTSVAIPGTKSLGDVYDVESFSFDTNLMANIILKQELPQDVLQELGEDRIDADVKYPTQTEVLWSELQGILPVTSIDWGSITDTTDLQTDDWGNIIDAATVLADWGTLTGSAKLTGFGKDGNDLYVTVYNEEDEVVYLLYKAFGSDWEAIDITSFDMSYATIYMAENKVFLLDQSAGLFQLVMGGLNGTYLSNGIETIIKVGQAYYLVSPKLSGNTRTVVSTTDFVTFSTPWSVELASVANPAEFLGKVYLGSTDTYVTDDMRDITDIEIYSENRCVVGDRLLNMNMEQYCSYTLDGVHFLPMPLVLSNQSAWGYKDGCTFIAVYGTMIDGVVGTQIYTANDFNPVWTPQTKVKGKVFDIEFDGKYAYFVSDVEVKSLEYRDAVVPRDAVSAYAFGEQIGRPQEIMNVMKYSLTTLMQLPMNPLALKDFLLLPHDQLNGEPVNYCFMREAQDGKMMVWGTPNKFGEYLRFSYVEPITLLSDAHSTPDFPDEYYEAVEDGLASQLAMQYGAPVERQQILAARAQESKENAILHDNEDASYDITPNQRWL